MLAIKIEITTDGGKIVADIIIPDSFTAKSRPTIKLGVVYSKPK